MVVEGFEDEIMHHRHVDQLRKRTERLLGEDIDGVVTGGNVKSEDDAISVLDDDVEVPESRNAVNDGGEQVCNVGQSNNSHGQGILDQTAGLDTDGTVCVEVAPRRSSRVSRRPGWLAGYVAS